MSSSCTAPCPSSSSVRRSTAGCSHSCSVGCWGQSGSHGRWRCVLSATWWRATWGQCSFYQAAFMCNSGGVSNGLLIYLPPLPLMSIIPKQLSSICVFCVFCCLSWWRTNPTPSAKLRAVSPRKTTGPAEPHSASCVWPGIGSKLKNCEKESVDYVVMPLILKEPNYYETKPQTGSLWRTTG